MPILSLPGVRVLALTAVAATAASPAARPRLPRGASHELATARCTLVPGRTLVLLRVERDTTLAFAPVDLEAMSASGVRPGPRDSLLAVPGTPMPAARVRLLQLDPDTRAAFERAGVAGDQPAAFIRAAPYRADCQTVRWTDTVPWTREGDVGFARATLAPPEHWIGGVPVLVIPDVWNYPYPRQRGLVYDTPPDAALASADALYGLQATLGALHSLDEGSDTVRARALAWARSQPAASELEPVRAIVHRAVLQADWPAVERTRSRLRGSYRVTMQGPGAGGTWYFRTHDRPGYRWREADSSRSTADLLASPHPAGYLLVGYAAGRRDALPRGAPPAGDDAPLVWLAAADRPTAPGNDGRRELRGALEFRLASAPRSLWDQLEPFVPAMSPTDSALLARMGHAFPRGERQPRLPLTLRLDPGGGVRADTSLTSGGRTLRVSLERVDTVSVTERF
jgi:hypothetical protein